MKKAFGLADSPCAADESRPDRLRKNLSRSRTWVGAEAPTLGARHIFRAFWKPGPPDDEDDDEDKVDAFPVLPFGKQCCGLAMKRPLLMFVGLVESF